MSIPSVACRTVMDVWLASRSTIMLSWLGSRCWTRMKAMPFLAGSASTSFLQASRPPAEAPIPTIKKSSRLRGGPRAGTAVPPERVRVGLTWGGRLLAILRDRSGNAPLWNRLLQVITGPLPARPERQGHGWPNGPPVCVVSEPARDDLTSGRVCGVRKALGEHLLADVAPSDVCLCRHVGFGVCQYPTWRFADAPDTQHTLREHSCSVRRASE